MNLLKQVKPGYYFLPKDQRKYFKNPLGKIFANEQDIIEIINVINQDCSIPKIISVGDATTHALVALSLIPDLAIIDEHIQRKRVPLLELPDVNFVEVSNPAGYITFEAWSEIIAGLKVEENKIIIKINGEEDLLVLPSILEAPLDSKVLYGQPNEGLVVVSVTEEAKYNVYELIRKMVKINED